VTTSTSQRPPPRTLLPRAPLIAAGAFSRQMDAERVAHSLARGLAAGGRPQVDLCLLPGVEEDPALRELLVELHFDERMHVARAVIIAAARLHEETLAGSMTFEIATRARQGGVPAYAVTAENELDGFDARLLDLQAIFAARSARALESAGRRLAQIV
jgi:glycerate kinase